jgi:sugar fermentation stimulation protein A
MDSGVYIAVFSLPIEQDITVGRRGRYRFRSGVYFYVGSAQKNLSARIERHARRQKPLRWHIDYLSVKASMMGAIIVPGLRDRECQLAVELEGLYELAVPGFGASDCRCRGHLFYTAEL